MKKFFLVPAIILAITSCNTVTTTPSDFTSLYNANIKAEIKESEAFWGSLYGQTKEFSGALKGAIEMIDPATGSGVMTSSFGSDYSGIAGGSSIYSQLALTSPKFQMEVTQGEETKKAEFSAKSIEMLSGLKGFINMTDVSIKADPLTEEEKTELQRVTDALTKYSGKWISLDQTSQELPESTMKFIEKLATLTPADIEKLLIENNVFVANGEPTVEGTKYTYNISLDHNKVSQIAYTLSQNLTGQELAEENKKLIADSVANYALTGTVTYDTKDALYSKFDLTLTMQQVPDFSVKIAASREGENMNVKYVLLNKDKEQYNFAFKAVTSGNNVDFSGEMNMGQGEKMVKFGDISGKIVDNELKNASFNITLAPMGGINITYIQGEKFTATANVQGVDMFNLENKISGQNHEGMIVAQGQEIANWSLQMQDSKLSALKLIVKNIASQISTAENMIEVNLVKEGGSEMASGKVFVNLGETPISTDLSLQIEKKVFGFILQNPALKTGETSMPLPLKKVEFFANYDEKTTDKKITLPTEVVSYEEFTQALGVPGFSGVDISSLEGAVNLENASTETSLEQDAALTAEEQAELLKALNNVSTTQE